jgi:hypothetical protein
MWVTLENLFKVTLSVVFTAVWLVGVRWVWTHQLDPVATAQRLMRKPFKAPEWVATREPNKFYQNGSVVGEVVGPVQEQDSNSIILFEKLANTGALKKDAVFQYQRYNLQIRQIEHTYQMQFNPGAAPMMAVLENVVCEKVR